MTAALGVGVRRADPLDLVKLSLSDSGWRINSVTEAGAATEGKRQEARVRWHPADIGAILVELGDEWVEVSAAQDEFCGVTASDDDSGGLA